MPCRTLALVVVLAIATVSGCTEGERPAATLDTVAPTQPTSVPTPTQPATSTSVTTDTEPAPVAAVVLPVPIAAPLDEYAEEPVVELGTIEIPALSVAATLYEGIRLTTFDRGPGHWPGSAMPGEFGNVVVGGHRTNGSKPFRHLDALVPGDEVIFTTAAGRFVYTVSSTEITTADDLTVVHQNRGNSATLFACHPVGSTAERIVVHLRLAPQLKEQP